MWPTVDQLLIVDLPKFKEQRGLLVPLELQTFVPFAVKRLFWISDVPLGEVRGAHAHKLCHQFLICTAGRLSIDAFDGTVDRRFELLVGQAVHIKPGIFTIERFLNPGSILTVLCDREYEVDDYLVDRESTVQFRNDHPR